MGDIVIEIKNLRVHYGKAEVLKGISMSVNRGEIVTLIGANGAGKTTILKTISGVKLPTSGEIWFQGRRIDGKPIHEIAKLGTAHIPEGRMVFASLTVMENLQVGAYQLKDKRKLAQNLEMVFKHFPVLKQRSKQSAASLSGGEQQMLATGRALMKNPKLLMMDEPSMGLSPRMVQEVAKIITDINGEGVSILLVEQNARMALRLSHRAYALEVGNVILEGRARELYRHNHIRDAYLGG